MKFTQVTMAVAAMVYGIEATAYPDTPDPYLHNLSEMFPNKVSLYSNNWDQYKKTRQLMVDCDIYESENWLGTGKCKYSWECRGARMCEGQGWCYGDDACEQVHE